MKKIDTPNLLRSAQKSLTFNITANMRLISIDNNDSGVDMYISSYEPLSEDEIDCIYGAAGEISGDFIDLDDINTIFSVNKEQLIDISRFKGTIVYARSEVC